MIVIHLMNETANPRIGKILESEDKNSRIQLLQSILIHFLMLTANTLGKGGHCK